MATDKNGSDIPKRRNGRKHKDQFKKFGKDMEDERPKIDFGHDANSVQGRDPNLDAALEKIGLNPKK
jgi:hypothetical protein